ncbi:MAG: Rrf2 family transcriptional regulator [bacterium]|nr:Rrf2 family transcriptional regulator [bacterium]
MKLSTRGNYGLRAVYELTRHYGQGPLTIRQISERQNIPLKYLEQLLHRLKKSGIIESVRGPTGGYALADDPANFSVGDILRVLEGPLHLSGCIRSHDSDHCLRHERCISNILWSEIEKKFAEVLDDISLTDLTKLDGNQKAKLMIR